jgi:hypothetical protein
VSFLGTLGPFVQGPSTNLAVRTRVLVAFALAFALGALVTFGGVWLFGELTGLADIDGWWRYGGAAVALVALAAVDLRSLQRSVYCPLGRRRQTPKRFARNHSPTVTAVVWGLDTGLAVTTIRIAAVTWGAFIVVALGFAPWWAGLCYGTAFAIPMVTMLLTHRVGRATSSATPLEPGLEAMLRHRTAVQASSAALLAATATVLVVAGG